ncbi:MAG TPA: hypothetical protein DCG19_12420 [Cryomorphaceae bacterium]|nr:hypothetical protein [Owenweeksia sp.]MBG00375.1 hypothetical protein [Owenweeksia sp.]HAD98206.1 hypothetical protein [Cryomorphaceae bacterium]HBF21555.1 hypothetical protein [Cryomorphaceae bacterium]HCQ16675.1 hypothetical protein [Cryomorphaceae bacterium]|tara:strand:+ start:1020 stop:1259 length:240 start_codon:yes stop_codon:yes gene_type:complete
MKVPAIRKLLKVDIEVLRRAEEDLAEERSPEIEIEGADEGEKLTHVFGAIWIQEQVASGAMNEKEALRAFMDKVRTSIS